MLIYMFSNNILALNQIGLSNEILDPEDAFKMKVSDIDDSLLLNWKIEKTYYIYTLDRRWGGRKELIYNI